MKFNKYQENTKHYCQQLLLYQNDIETKIVTKQKKKKKKHTHTHINKTHKNQQHML